MTSTTLLRVEVVGVAGLPDLELDLGPVTALTGPRGTGKSQLLTSVAWLMSGQPRPAWADGISARCVRGDLSTGGRTVAFTRRPGARRHWTGGPMVALPTCSYLRARDRLAPAASSPGHVARRLTAAAAHPTSDALAAEALVSIVESCCEDCLTGELLLIEEPELLLTPQAQRYLYRLLRRFAENGNQVLYSTRSPAFVDAAHHDEIVRLDLRRGRRSIRRTTATERSDPERVRLAAEFDHERGEMFFARAVVLVEGQTERLSLPFVFQALGHEPDAEGIAIVEVGGKSNLPLAARLLRQLGIPFVVVSDADRGPAATLADEAIRDAAGQAPTFRLLPDFEAVAGIASHQDKILHAWKRFAHGRPEQVAHELASVVQAAVLLAGEPADF